MDVTRFTVSGYKGYRFLDVKGRGCSVHQCDKGLTVGVNISGGEARMVLDKELSLWMVQVLLDYIETGKI